MDALIFIMHTYLYSVLCHLSLLKYPYKLIGYCFITKLGTGKELSTSPGCYYNG